MTTTNVIFINLLQNFQLLTSFLSNKYIFIYMLNIYVLEQRSCEIRNEWS